MPTWLITGCSTELGRSLATAALRRGFDVAVTARDPSSVDDIVAAHPDSALALALDVTDPAQIKAAVAATEDRFGGIDVLVNNAGYGYRAAVEEGDEADVRTLFDVHFHGPVGLIKTVLPGMRERRSGTIVNISSIGARRSPAGSGYYSAVKAAQEAMTASLRKEIGPLGITAIAVEPGGFRTDFAGRSLAGPSAPPIADYADTAGPRRKENDAGHGTQPGDPDKAAAALIDVVQSHEPPFMLVLGPDALQGFRAALDELAADLDAWESTSVSTDLG